MQTGGFMAQRHDGVRNLLTSLIGKRFAPTLKSNHDYNLSIKPRPQGFSLKKWVGREKALPSAEKLIYMQPAGFALTEVERSNNGK